MTVLSHAKEKHSSGSYAAFLNKSISALNKNKKLILDSGIILLNQLQQFLVKILCSLFLKYRELKS